MSVAGDSSHTGVKVSNLNMHHTWGSGFGVFNTPDIVVDSVKVWQAKMSFAEACIVGGNGFNINNSTGGTVRNSHVYNNYGEGATSDQSSNIIYKNNYFYDNYHANLHVHGSKGTVVDGNVVYCSTNAPYPFQKRNLGILLADEVKSTQANTSNVGEKRTIINNLVVGCNDGIAIRSQFASKIKDDVFAYNTVVASRPKPGEKADSHSAFSLRPDTSAIVTNSYFGNNLIIQDGGTMCNGLGCTASGLTKENNMLVTLEQGKNYITSPTSVTVSSWPPGQSGSSQGPAMILSNPSNITAEHLKTQFSMQNYQLTSSSLAQKKGKPLAQVSQDLLKQKRPTSGNYAIGAFESSTNNNPPPSGNNAAAADLNADGKVDYADFTLAVSNFGNPYTAFDVNNVITYYKQ
jgi:hypothetical protein